MDILCTDGMSIFIGINMSIHIKKSHEGLLHKNLHVKAGEPIPYHKMITAKKNASPAEKKRIVFAENARKWHHGSK